MVYPAELWLMKLKTTTYKELLTQDNFTEAWMPEECFHVDSSAPNQLENLKELIGVEISFLRSSLNEEVSELYQSLEFFMITCILPKLKTDVFLFDMDYQALPKSKVRSYKGLAKRKKVFSGDVYVEKETLFSDETSLFASIIDVGMVNSKLIFEKYLYDSQRSFLLVSAEKEKVFSMNFLDEIAVKLLSREGLAYVNYLSLITKYCIDDTLVIRIVRDANTEVSIQIFAHKSKLSDLEKLACC